MTNGTLHAPLLVAAGDIAGLDGKAVVAGKIQIARIEHRCGVRIPMHRGHLLRFDRGQATDLMAATIPI